MRPSIPITSLKKVFPILFNSSGRNFIGQSETNLVRLNRNLNLKRCLHIPVTPVSNVVREKQIQSADNLKVLEDFDIVFSDMVNTIRAEFLSRNLREVADWLEKAMNYNVPYGKKNRGIALVKTFTIISPENENSINLNAVRLLGWCVEMLQTFFIVLDDVMDHSISRRGKDCWYRKEGVGLTAINDAILMEQAIFLILKRHFSTHLCYLDIMETFHDVSLWTSMGQCLDMLSTPTNTKPDLNLFTIERYQSITTYKTAYYTIYLPVKLGILLAGKKHYFTKEVEDILLSIGHYFQIQDDILDCFGDPKVTGKIGTDIEDGKCCWPIVVAYQKASMEDRQILKENYGIKRQEAVAKVKNVYTKLDILAAFENFEKQTYRDLLLHIEKVCSSSEMPKEILLGLLNKIYKRKK